MNSFIDPSEIRRELGLVEPPFALAEFQRHMGVTIRTEPGVRAGGATTWNLDGRFTIALPPGPRDRTREAGSHELGHIAYGDVGPHQAVLYARGTGRTDPGDRVIEERATNWGIDALIGRGPLGIAIRHNEITTASALAERFLVTTRFVIKAALRYGLDHLILQDHHRYAACLGSSEWIRLRNEILAARRVCERCRSARSEEVIHLRYDTLGRERSEDVQAVCRTCNEELEIRSVITAAHLALLPNMHRASLSFRHPRPAADASS